MADRDDAQQAAGMLSAPAAFSWTNAYAAARIAAASYGADTELKDQLEWDKTTTAMGCNICYYPAGENLIAIGIEGTTKFTQWLSYFAAHNLVFPWGKECGFGIFEPFWLLSQWAKEIIAQRIHKENQIILCGHSLGGAIAMILARELFEKGWKVVTYTFGQPRAGTTKFAETYLAPLFRLWETNDPVPKTPIRVDFREMAHAGTSIELESPIGVFQAHFIQNYVNYLATKAAEEQKPVSGN